MTRRPAPVLPSPWGKRRGGAVRIEASGPGHGLRPLRDPDATEDADDE